MAVEQLRSLISAIRKDPARAPDGKYDQVSDDKTSVVADMYNLDFKDKKMLLEVSYPKTLPLAKEPPLHFRNRNCSGFL